MPDLPERTRRRPGPGLLLAFGALAAVGAIFYLRQQRGHIGGAISVPKTFWLAYALAVWYVVPLFFWRDRRLSPQMRRIFALHLLLWTGRAIAELLLMALHSWKPPYGIAFDSFALAMLAGLLLGDRSERLEGDRNARALVWLMMASLVPEMVFAWLFHEAMSGHTETTWFADASPRFVFINRLTTGVDFLVYSALALVTARYQLGERRPLPGAGPPVDH